MALLMRIHVEQVERMNNSKISIPGIFSVAGAWIKLPQQMNPQPVGPGYPSLSGSYHSTCPTWVAPPLATLQQDSIGGELQQVYATNNYYFTKLQSLKTCHHTSEIVNKNNYLILFSKVACTNFNTIFLKSSKQSHIPNM
jgi:hypothetical protein